MVLPENNTYSLIEIIRRSLRENDYLRAVDLLRLCVRNRYPSVLVRSVLSEYVFYVDACYLDLSLASPDILLFPYLPREFRPLLCGLNPLLIETAHNCTLEDFVLYHLNSVLKGEKPLCLGVPAIDIRDYHQRLLEDGNQYKLLDRLSAIECLMRTAYKNTSRSTSELAYWCPSWHDRYYRPKFTGLSLQDLSNNQSRSFLRLEDDIFSLKTNDDYCNLVDHASRRTLEGNCYYMLWNSCLSFPQDASSYVYALASNPTDDLTQIVLADNGSYELVEVSSTTRPSILLIDSCWLAIRQPEEIIKFFQNWIGGKNASLSSLPRCSNIRHNRYATKSPQLRKPPETLLVMLATKPDISSNSLPLMQKRAKEQACLGGFDNGIVLCLDRDHQLSLESWRKNHSASCSHPSYVSFIGIRDSVQPFSSDDISAACVFEPDVIICTDEELIWESESQAIGQRQFSAKVTPFRVISRGHIPGLATVPLAILSRLTLESSYLSIHAFLKDIVLQHLNYGGTIKTLPCALLHRDLASNPSVLSVAFPAQRNPFNKEQLAEIARITHQRSNAWLDNEGGIRLADRQGCFSFRYTCHSPILVSVVIPYRDAAELTRQCVTSLLENAGSIPYEIILVDNGSICVEARELEASLSPLASQRGVSITTVHDDKPFNYSRINNSARTLCRGQFILFANNDIVFRSHGALNALLDPFGMKDVAAVGARLLYEDGTIQHNGLMSVSGEIHDTLSPGKGLRPGYETRAFIALENQEQWSAATAACLMVRASDFDLVKGFDESYAVAYNDVDLCWNLNSAGKAVVVVPDVLIIHAESKTRGHDFKGEKRIRLYAESYLLRSRHPSYFKDGDHLAHPYLDPHSPRFRPLSRPAKPVSLSRDEILFTWTRPEIRKKANSPFMIYVHWDPYGRIRKDIYDQLCAYQKHSRIAFVSASPELIDRSDDLELLKNQCDVILVRRNEGYDFGSWRAGIAFCDCFIRNADWLILVNDSCYGPLGSIDHIFAELDCAQGDVVGLTDNTEISYHLQSYFIAYRKRVHQSPLFKCFWGQIGVWDSKMDLIRNYEIGWSRVLDRAGFSLGALCSNHAYGNQTHLDWQSLIVNRKFPFLKVELVRDNPLGVDLSGLVPFLKKHKFEAVLSTLARVGRK